MSFALSAEHVRLDEGHILRAQLRDMEGEFKDASIDLDRVIGNNWGRPPAFEKPCF